MKTSEKRRHQRKSTSNSNYPRIWFVVYDDMSSSVELVAAVTDISESGVGLNTQVALEPGQRIRFTRKETEEIMAEDGIVMWAAELQDGYKAGVMFS